MYSSHGNHEWSYHGFKGVNDGLCALHGHLPRSSRWPEMSDQLLVHRSFGGIVPKVAVHLQVVGVFVYRNESVRVTDRILKNMTKMYSSQRLLRRFIFNHKLNIIYEICLFNMFNESFNEASFQWDGQELQTPQILKDK